MFANRAYRHLELGLLVATLTLMVIGLVAIYSATYGDPGYDQRENFHRQMMWMVLGLGVLAATAIIHFTVYYKYAYSIYAGTLVLLLLVLVAGTGGSVQRWLALGPLWIQPAEFAKIGTLLALAKYLQGENRNLNSPKDLSVAFGLTWVPAVLIIQQPDLGSALIFPPLALAMLHWAGLPHIILFVLVAPLLSLVCAFNFYSFFAIMILISLVLLFSQRGLRFFLLNFVINVMVGVLTPVLWNWLKPYQKERILTFLGLVTDPSGLGYQVIQSKVAVGSGGFAGKGYLQGTQTHLRFLPEQHTDFIISVIGEEFGFVGVVLVLGLFLYIALKSLRLATEVKSDFARLVVFGAVIVMVMQIFVNVGMTVGIMPVVGIPLPFLSYGGSSFLTQCVLIGFVLNASMRRFAYL